MSFGVWECTPKRDTMKLIPSEMTPLVTQRCNSTPEPSEIVQVLEQDHNFWNKKCVKCCFDSKTHHFHAEIKHIKGAVANLRCQSHQGTRRH